MTLSVVQGEESQAIVDVLLTPSGRREGAFPSAFLLPSEMTGHQCFQVRLADSPKGRSDASLLIKQRYEWRGYEVPGLVGAPEVITLCASDEKGVIGTVTLRLDGESGLLCQSVYGDKVSVFRQEAGAKLCELCCLAVERTKVGRHVLGALIHVAYIYARVLNGATRLLIEVNPRHVDYYCRLLGFVVAGEERFCDRAAAPAVLLQLPLSHADEELRRFGGGAENHPAGVRSIYPYCFSLAEEAGIVGRVRTMQFGKT